MAMNKVPTLVLGIGGIGCRIAAAISDMLSDEDRKYVGIVGMDTNVNDLNKLKEHNMRVIRTSDDRNVRDYLRQHPKYARWFPVHRFTVDKNMVNGAGQIRAVSRLAAIAAEERGAFIPIVQEIQRIRANDGEENKGNLTVMVVGSITGGTGAGIFLQLPYYIRQHMKHSDGLEGIIIRGMFVSADITGPVQPSKINKDAVYVNAYACLKELNAIYMTQTDASIQDRIQLEWYEKHSARETEMTMQQMSEQEGLDTDFDVYDDDDASIIFGGKDVETEDKQTLATNGANIPYDYLYLIESSNASGGIGQAAMASIENQIARMVFTLMFTPLGDDALSVEDNFVLHSMKEGGMNRYSSAGMCRLLFPQEQVREYVTLCSVRDLVNDEWLLLDNAYAAEVEAARANQRTDSTAEIPKIKKSYPALFEESVLHGGTLGRLRNEAYVVNADTHKPVSRAVSYVGRIMSAIQEVMDSEELQTAKKNCKINVVKMKKVEDARGEVSRVFTALEEFENLAKEAYTNNRGRIANNLFPGSWSVLLARKDKDDCIYSLLSGVHPVTARFLCYGIIGLLEKKIKEMEENTDGVDLNAFEEVDYNPRKPGTQSARDYLQSIEDDRSFVGNSMNSMGINPDGKKLTRLRIKLQEISDGQATLISDYYSDLLTLHVCRTILNRVEKLAENYQIFFQSIGAMIRENNNRIELLEDVKLPLGCEGIFCSREAFRNMAAAYSIQVDSDLPEETKTAVFEQLFHVMADDLAIENMVMSELAKENYTANKKQTLSNIFTTAVIDTLRAKVSESADSNINMNARQALAKEFELKTGKTSDNCKTYDDELRDFIRERILTAMGMAAPMLAVDASTGAENTETVYLALHPDCAVQQMGKPDVGASKEYYIPAAAENTGNKDATVLMDPEFSRNEIACFRARYNFVIEDLVKYRSGSISATAYQERIRMLGRKPASTNDPNAFMTVVNPHLDRFWHEEGIIPAISGTERRASWEDTLKAFVYAMGLDLYTRMEDMDNPVYDDDDAADDGEAASTKGRLTWFIRDSKGVLVPVKACNHLIGNEYEDVFRSLPLNGRTKKYILARARAYIKAKKGTREAAELYNDILEDAFINDLIQADGGIFDEGDLNIFDIFLRMRESMEESVWTELFTGLQLTLWEFLSKLFDSNEKMVNDAYVRIVDQIFKESLVGKTDAAERTLPQKRLEEQYRNIRKARFSR